MNHIAQIIDSIDNEDLQDAMHDEFYALNSDEQPTPIVATISYSDDAAHEEHDIELASVTHLRDLLDNNEFIELHSFATDTAQFDDLDHYDAQCTCGSQRCEIDSITVTRRTQSNEIPFGHTAPCLHCDKDNVLVGDRGLMRVDGVLYTQCDTCASRQQNGENPTGRGMAKPTTTLTK